MTEQKSAAERINAGEVFIFGGRISWRAPQFEHSQCWQALVSGYGRIHDGSIAGDAFVERSRSVLASIFLRSECEVMLTIDDDIIFNPTDALTICAAAIERQAIVCGVYPTRGRKSCAPAVMLKSGTPTEFVGGRHTLVEILWGASGFMATPRCVIEKMAARTDLPELHALGSMGSSFQSFYHGDTVEDFEGSGENIRLSEDYGFCKLAREEGFTIWADTGVRLGHIGTYVYTMGDIVGDPDYQGRVRLTRHEGNKLLREWDDVSERKNHATGLVLPSGAHVREPELARTR